MVKVIKRGDINMKASKEFCCPWCKEIARVLYKDEEDKKYD